MSEVIDLFTRQKVVAPGATASAQGSTLSERVEAVVIPDYMAGGEPWAQASADSARWFAGIVDKARAKAAANADPTLPPSA